MNKNHHLANAMIMGVMLGILLIAVRGMALTFQTIGGGSTGKSAIQHMPYSAWGRVSLPNHRHVPVVSP